MTSPAHEAERLAVAVLLETERMGGDRTGVLDTIASLLMQWSAEIKKEEVGPHDDPRFPGTGSGGRDRSVT